MPATSFVLEDVSNMNINDTDLFNYFLNDDLSCNYDESSLSPSSSSDSPQTSPPQLIPESPEFASEIVSQMLFDQNPFGRNESIQIKEETINALPAGSSLTDTSGASRKRSLKDSSVALSQDELLKLSSKSFDNYPQTPSRPLSQEEERQLKRQRRLIKNRESAQLSRMRKKIYIEELEKKVSNLTAENDNLAKQIISISTDKRKLEEEVLYLQSIIKQSPALVNIVANKPTARFTNSSKNVKTAGICLLIVLFSFGLLFNGASDLPFSKRARDDTNSKSIGRTLKGVKDEKIDVAAKISEHPINESPIVEVSASKKRTENGVDKNYPEKQISSEKRIDNASFKKKKITIAEESNKELVPVDASHIRYVKNNSVEVLQTHSLSRPDTSYIYCSEAQQVHSTTSPLGNTREPQNIALLIPSSVLNATLDPRMDKSLLEVSCQVLNLHLWPMTSVANNTMNP